MSNRRENFIRVFYFEVMILFESICYDLAGLTKWDLSPNYMNFSKCRGLPMKVATCKIFTILKLQLLIFNTVSSRVYTKSRQQSFR